MLKKHHPFFSQTKIVYFLLIFSFLLQLEASFSTENESFSLERIAQTTLNNGSSVSLNENERKTVKNGYRKKNRKRKKAKKKNKKRRSTKKSSKKLSIPLGVNNQVPNNSSTPLLETPEMANVPESSIIVNSTEEDSNSSLKTTENPLYKPFISCSLFGQLGNQLFEIATTLAMAWDNDYEAFFPDLNRSELNIPMNRERIFFRLNNSPLPRPALNVFEDFSSYCRSEIPKKPDQLLRGHFFSWHHFHHYRERLVEIFSPSEKELADLKLKHAKLLKHPLTVSVHVRTFNQFWSQYLAFVGMDYYQKAMDLFPEGTLFVIFSDRIQWCKQHFKDIKRPMVFIEDQDHLSDFFLMSILKHHIIGNSSYSWWAAYLNTNPEKIVVTPKHFLTSYPNINSNMPGWIEIENDTSLSYPKDMLDYDTYSKSIDTQ
jgi:hypothetical protein